MTTIDQISTVIIDLPTIRGHVLSMATMTVQSVVIVRMRFSDGSQGLGEGASIGGLSYGTESPESIKSAIDTYIAPALIGLDADNVNAALDHIERAVLGNPIARSAVEIALWDGLGKRLGVPVSQLFGGAAVSGIDVAWTLASGDSVHDIEEAQELLQRRRHRQFKLKIGKRSVQDDLAHVGRIAAALGDDVTLTVDVNQAWDLHDARRGLAGLQEIGVVLVEQPIGARHVNQMRLLNEQYEIAVMADEALNGPTDALNFASAGAADAFAVKVAQSGGLKRASEVMAIGRAAGIGLYGGTMLESGVATAAALQVFCTMAPLRWGCELFGPLLFADEILEKPLRYENFQVHLPDGPGTGVALNEEKISRFQRDRSNLVPVRIVAE